jgi:hypothetical protein
LLWTIKDISIVTDASVKDVNFVGYTHKNFEIVTDHEVPGIDRLPSLSSPSLVIHSSGVNTYSNNQSGLFDSNIYAFDKNAFS